jgi:hypothetical protein
MVVVARIHVCAALVGAALLVSWYATAVATRPYKLALMDWARDPSNGSLTVATCVLWLAQPQVPTFVFNCHVPSLHSTTTIFAPHPPRHPRHPVATSLVVVCLSLMLDVAWTRLMLGLFRTLTALSCCCTVAPFQVAGYPRVPPACPSVHGRRAASHQRLGLAAGVHDGCQHVPPLPGHDL